MFEKLKITLLVHTNLGYRELPVYSMDNELFCKVGSNYLRIKKNGNTSNPKMTWIKFSSNWFPTYTKLGWARSDKWSTKRGW